MNFCMQKTVYIFLLLVKICASESHTLPQFRLGHASSFSKLLKPTRVDLRRTLNYETRRYLKICQISDEK